MGFKSFFGSGGRSSGSDDYYSGYSRGWGGYSWGSSYKSLFKGDEIFVDKSSDLPKNDEEITEYGNVNKYNIPNIPKDFLGCLYWVKDIDADDKRLMRQFGTQAASVSRYISGIKPAIAVEDGGSHVSYDGTKMHISVSSMYDHRINIEDRIDIFFANLLHEVFHLKYTIGPYGVKLTERGYVKQKLSKYGKIINVPDYKINLFGTDKLLARLFNVVEDYRIERLGLLENPGYVGYFDKMLAYYNWMYYPQIKSPSPNKDAFLLNYIEIKVLRVNDKISDKYESLNVDNFARYSKEIDTIDSLLKEIPEDFDNTYILANKLRDLFDGDKGYGNPDECAGHIPKGTYKIKPGAKMDKGDKSKIEENIGIGSGDAGDKNGSEIGEGDSKRKSKDVSDKAVGLHGVREDYFKHTSVYNTDVGDFNSTIYNEAVALSKTFSKDLEFLNSKLTGVEETFELDNGELDEDEIYGIKFNKNIFKDEEPAKEYSMDLFLLVDESGSMGGSKVQVAKKCALAMYLAFKDESNVDTYVYGHSAQEFGDHDSVELFRYIDPNVRGCDPNSMFSIQGRCENVDGVAILEAADILKKGRGASKVMIVLSDGQPAASGYHGEGAIKHTKMCVDEAEAMGIFVVQVAIDNIHASPMMFKNYVPYTGTENVGRDLMRILKTEFSKIANNV